MQDYFPSGANTASVLDGWRGRGGGGLGGLAASEDLGRVVVQDQEAALG